mmetsp:Transcript_2670/g.7406  ORF Transcript_2670/g.7406 Transcript_2670/m.7406 type:complete len:632 (+) Transcript_2670:18-1913(+)
MERSKRFVAPDITAKMNPAAVDTLPIRDAVKSNWQRFLNQGTDEVQRMFHPREEGALTLLTSNLGKNEIDYLIEKAAALPKKDRPQRLHLQLNQNLNATRVSRLIHLLNLCGVHDMILFFYTLVPVALMEQLKNASSMRSLEFNGGHGAFPGLGGFTAGPDLESLCLSGLRVSHIQLHAIISSLQPCKAFKHFKLEFCRCYADSMFFLARLAYEHPSLDFVEVAGLNMERNLPLEESELFTEAIVKHPKLRKISLSVDQSQIHLIGPLTNDFSGCKSLESIRFRNPFFDGEKLGDLLKITIQNSAVQVERFMEAVSTIENVKRLHVDGMLGPRHLVRSIFTNPQCCISKLSLDQELDGEELFQLCSGLETYEHLTNVSLRLGTVTRFEKFFPRSTLVNVSLAFWNPGSPPFEIMAIMLREQRNLIHLKAEVLDVIAFKPEDKFPAFADALQDHPRLETFYFGWTSIVFIGLDKPGIQRWLPRLFPAVAKNDVLKKLDISELDVEMDTLVDALPKFKTLQAFHLPIERIQDMARLREALRQNTCIRSIEDPRESNFATFRDHIGFTEIMERNTLLHRSGNICDLRDHISPGLLAHIVAKLGSNNNEPSPVFDFLRAGSDSLTGYVRRKRPHG